PAGRHLLWRGGPRGSRLPELTKRTILMLKEANPTWGCQKISDMLLRGPALPAGPSAVSQVLHEAGYELEEVPTRPHPDLNISNVQTLRLPYALAIAEKMGMQRHEIDRLRLAGLLHDIGKIGTYDVLLDKTGKLTEEEWELIKLHPNRGCEILEPITEFKDILPAVRHHHERWDGKGYPGGLKGEDIPIMARILTVADSFDTMTADRPYRPAIGLSNATQEIAYCAGTQFAPDVAEVFLKLIRENGPEITNHSKPILKKIAPPQIWGTS
ncbi:MAG: HD-GYP domain-containing protein, partial [Nitrospirota bacterium]